MPILESDLFLYGSAVMPDDDVTLAIGGAIALTKKVSMTDVDGLVQLVSSSVLDVTQNVTVHFRTPAGALGNEVKMLNGQTPVLYAASMERLLKAIKAATTVGDVAVEDQVAARTGTAQAGDADSITLDVGASAVNDFFSAMVCRLTGGTGAGQIREFIDYDGTNKRALVSRPWTINPDATSIFRVSRGFFFDRSPSEIFEVRRPFYNAQADPPGGVNRKFYEKVFYKNIHGALSLTLAKISEQVDPSALVAFGLAVTLNDVGTNGGANNRQVAPAGITFDSSEKTVATGDLPSASAQGVWLELTLNAGEAAQKNSYTLRIRGNTT